MSCPDVLGSVPKFALAGKCLGRHKTGIRPLRTMEPSSEPPLLPRDKSRAAPPRWGLRVAVALGLLVAGTLGYCAYHAFKEVREVSIVKSLLPRQPAGALDQFFVDNEDRIFVRYDEIVGPDDYIKAYNAPDDADISFQFPLRRYWCETLKVRLPDGTTVLRNEVIASRGRSGLIATYPLPEDDKYVPHRVYRLDSGVTLRDRYVVNLPPDPAGRQGRDQDGVHVYQLPDGRRFEITYHGGVPDGPFHAYYADGKPWGEATYRQGRVVAASIITRDGRKLDELASGGQGNGGAAGR